MIGFQVKRIIRSGVKSLWLHKMRSGLTALGIMFGVCSVIAMLAIGTGASEEAQAQIRKLGSNNIIIQSVQPPESQTADTQATTRVNQYGLTYGDAARIRDTVPNVVRVVPARNVRANCYAGNRRMDTDIVGTVSWYAEVNNVSVTRGRFLSQMDMDRRSPVCVLGKDAANVLFPLGDSLGSYVLQGNLRFKVVGIVSSFARGEFGGKKVAGNPNSEIYTPITAMDLMFGPTTAHASGGSMTFEQVDLHELTVQVDSLDNVRRAQAVIGRILQQSHPKQDYQVIVPLELLVQARRTKRIFSIVLGSIAAISLLVGGIGIMNITLATVMERTREIGIRRAMGAKRRHIIVQFLAETLLLAMFGGTLGIVLGVVVPRLVQHFAGMKTIVTAWSLLLAFFISAGVGIGFGLYPAYRAANMDPIEALRHE
jgi:putative ABC transport system permease protein